MSAKQLMAVDASRSLRNESLDKRAAGQQHSIKRMIFVASMYFCMNGINHPTKDQLAEVNQRFDLVNRASALLFPAAICKIVWGKVDLPGILERYKADHSAFATLSVELLSQTPDWVKYADGSSIVHDIKAVFDSMRTA